MVDPDKRVSPDRVNPDRVNPDRVNPDRASSGATTPPAAGTTGSGSVGSASGTAGAAGKPQTEHAKDDVKHKAQQTAGEVQDAARQQAESTFNRQTGAAAQETEKVANVFHKMADEFKNQDQAYFSRYANDLARGTDALSRRLREKNLQDLLGDVQRYGRQRPAALMGGAIAVGFLLSRFLKSSQRHDDHPQGGPGGTYPY
ncbi:hypothetical protein FGL86_02795 [Pistricoccus aurantiacus]|uniref:DUF883 family protein n=1 Tax=Pistricoccus aurantiacus TaxID=1883414 RepID=A0A5B8SP72_9GAMM|nr:hypothetical protein [Pistricoccus aurantiacus]QEA38101.1 hypothetical protein FGL86_02795 [Pistricoccus aurantiacus]